MDDLKSIVEYHEQARRSIENQLGQLVESQQRTQRSLDTFKEESQKQMEALRRLQQRNEQFLARAFRLGVVAVRRERVRRLEEDRRLAERQATDRAAWEERQANDRAAWEERMERTERNIDRMLEGFQGRNGGNGGGRVN